MRFKSLYSNNKKAVKDTLNSLWCAELTQQAPQQTANQSTNKPTPQRSQQYCQAKLISQTIDKFFAPKTSMPIVQYAESYIETPNPTAAKALVEDANGNSLWTKPYNPYQHQYRCWEALMQDVTLTQTDGTTIQAKKSIVVTTGTGSGKTECFMLPLVSELLRTGHINQLQAIFLYPLNALMEDQKQRLQDLLNGTQLHFSVYNGNLPEEITNDNVQDLKDELTKYPNILPTRKLMRGMSDNSNLLPNVAQNVRADIILTNPTMLEYMMLRPADKTFISNADLRWVVVDETHTYTGAGATELSMLFRRVMEAFQKTPSAVRFATSSATIGNSQNPATIAANDYKLRKFIADLAGQDIQQIELVKGIRKDPTTDSSIIAQINGDPELHNAYNLLYKKEYIKLDELDSIYATFPGATIEEKLAALDALCNRGLKVKVHFFHRVLNGGLRVRLDKIDDNNGTFQIYTEEPFSATEPYLELKRCSCCGGYIAIGEEYNDANGVKHIRKQITNDDDIFVERSNVPNTMVYGMVEPSSKIVGSVAIDVQHPDTYTPIIPNTGKHYVLAQNIKLCCPHCGKELFKKQDAKQYKGEIEIDEEKVTSFRVSTDLTARMIAPSVLDELQQGRDINGNPIDFPHQGQKYLSFVDSRQGAARATLNQLKEEEKLWVFSKVFNELNRLASIGVSAELSWMQIFDILLQDPRCDYFCRHAANRKSDEVDAHGNPTAITKRMYVHSLVYDHLAKRPLKALSIENMGLCVSTYPLLNNITHVPQNVQNILPSLSLQEWKNLLKIYLDRYVRGNEMYFLLESQLVGSKTYYYDTKSCKRFAAERHATSPAEKQIAFPSNHQYRLLIKLIAAAIWEKQGNVGNITNSQITAVVQACQAEITTISDAIWDDLVHVGLLEESKYYKNGQPQSDDNDCYDANGNLVKARLNLKNLSFKLYDTVYFCNVVRFGKQEIYRPYDTLFLGYSPYAVHNGLVKVDISHQEIWKPYPYVDGLNSGIRISASEVEQWTELHRKLLYEYHLWGSYGVFSNRLDKVYLYPNLFIQAEDTAQVDKHVVKENRELFKQHQINILACSTTMEMGVDLGDLELVMMNSVPPLPANFKQRAGRSGRAGQNRSASITLCSSDSVGLRTLYEPLEQLILRETSIPFVDMSSEAVIQRHVNAYLFRKFVCAILPASGNVINYKLLDFTTDPARTYKIQKNNTNYQYRVHEIDIRGASTQIFPDIYLSTITQDYFHKLRAELTSYQTDTAVLADLNSFLVGTCLDGHANDAIKKACDLFTKLHDKFLDDLKEIENRFSQLPTTQQNEKNPICRRILFDFTSLLGKQLIEYLATHRFIPNANMPIEIIEFAVNNEYSKLSNPSYTLREALSQYAPGSNVVLSNRTKVVRGLKYSGQYQQAAHVTTIYHSTDDVALDSNPFGTNALIWSVNDQEALELIEPYQFLPDANEAETRQIGHNPYTQVSAQLIGANQWATTAANLHLYERRTNADSPNAKILYYNEGIGYGYCICMTCGRVSLETRPAIQNGVISYIPSEMLSKDVQRNGTPLTSRSGSPIKTHLHLQIKDTDCPNYGNKKNYRRNVIIGSLIQTDYTEIKFFNKLYKNLSIEVLNTLGIAFCRMLTEFLGKESRDVDFLMTPNQTLCVFDTNPGGSGYANQLQNPDLFDIIVDNAEVFLHHAKTNNRKDEILDKFTVRYIDAIDIDGALDWLHQEQNKRPNPPQSVLLNFPNAHKVLFADLAAACQTGNVQLYFLDDSHKWSYQDSTNKDIDWLNRGNLLGLAVTNPKRFQVSIVCSTPQAPTFVQPIYHVLQHIESWADMYYLPNNLPVGYYPIAVANNCLYFTDCHQFASLNADWATEQKLYCIPLKDLTFTLTSATPLNVHPVPTPNLCKFQIDPNTHTKIISNELADIIFKANNQGHAIIQQFIDYCHQDPQQQIVAVYQDEHLKSAASIVTTAQFVDWFANQFGNSLSFHIYVENYYEKDAKRDSIGTNLDNTDRNDLLVELYENWQDDSSLLQNFYLHEMNRRTLPHWRVLSFTCGKKQLNLYPNGGIINEWQIDKLTQTPIPTYNNIDWDSKIPLYHNQPIMYDVELVDL